MGLSDILEVADAGGTLLLAVVAIYKMHLMQGTMKKLSDDVVSLMAKDLSDRADQSNRELAARTEHALKIGQTLGHIEAQLSELVADSREERISCGSDTRHKKADRKNYPSGRH